MGSVDSRATSAWPSAAAFRQRDRRSLCRPQVAQPSEEFHRELPAGVHDDLEVHYVLQPSSASHLADLARAAFRRTDGENRPMGIFSF
jgi:hypothetical protein